MDTIKSAFTFILNFLRITTADLFTQLSLYNQRPRHLSDNPINVQEKVQEQNHDPNRGPSPLIVFMLGPPGAGKGTQSAALCARNSRLTHLSFGDLLRHHDRIPGDWVTSFPRRDKVGNRMLPPGYAVQLLRRTIKEGVNWGQMTWLVDGFPRNEEHVAAWLDSMPPAQCAFYLRCDPNVLLTRVIERAAAGSGRVEDRDINKARERINRNIHENQAMLDILKANGIRVIQVDTNRSVDSVSDELEMHFKKSSKNSTTDGKNYHQGRYPATLNISSAKSVESCVNALVSEFGRPDHVFNCPMIKLTFMPLSSISKEYFDRLIGVNLEDTYNIKRG
ncbi:P-loop containing nucleoside triphosphate hydrolase protein [Biscogniauxia sp. FL1348]|nr:P-loop containing nucleoside triphosphate hydrolase protein [Biscogniauxia sp. FL1348]